MKQVIVFILSSMMLYACQQPTTYGPKVTADELAAEQAAQRQMAASSEIERQHKRQLRYIDMNQQLARVAIPVAKAGAQLCVQIRPVGSPCVFDFQIAQDKDIEREGAREPINAYADGEHIYVTPGMMRFIKNDDELALVLSHELAHNIMGHVASQRVNSVAGSLIGLALDVAVASQGYNTQGGFSNIGSGIATAAYSVDFEKEADYVGLYIMSQSGFKVTGTESFWRRFSVAQPEGIEGGISHPSNPERFIGMQKTIKEIEYKRKHGIPLLPDFKENAIN